MRKEIQKTINSNLVDISNAALFDAHNLAKATQLTLLEKIVLLFIKRKYFVDGMKVTTIEYKMWRCKTYILKHYNNPPYHSNCKCTLPSRDRNKYREEQ